MGVLSEFSTRACSPRIAPATWTNDAPLETIANRSAPMAWGPNVDQARPGSGRALRSLRSWRHSASRRCLLRAVWSPAYLSQSGVCAVSNRSGRSWDHASRTLPTKPPVNAYTAEGWGGAVPGRGRRLGRAGRVAVRGCVHKPRTDHLHTQPPWCGVGDNRVARRRADGLDVRAGARAAPLGARQRGAGGGDRRLVDRDRHLASGAARPDTEPAALLPPYLGGGHPGRHSAYGGRRGVIAAGGWRRALLARPWDGLLGGSRGGQRLGAAGRGRPLTWRSIQGRRLLPQPDTSMPLLRSVPELEPPALS